MPIENLSTHHNEYKYLKDLLSDVPRKIETNQTCESWEWDITEEDSGISLGLKKLGSDNCISKIHREIDDTFMVQYKMSIPQYTLDMPESVRQKYNCLQVLILILLKNQHITKEDITLDPSYAFLFKKTFTDSP
jgi:hypothetical protein